MSTPCVFGPVTPFTLSLPPPQPATAADPKTTSNTTATRTIGLPIVVVRRRSGRAGSLAPVAVCEPHHVVELRRRHLEDLAVLDRLDRMHLARHVAPGVARPYLDGLELVLRRALREPKPTAHQVR